MKHRGLAASTLLLALVGCAPNAPPATPESRVASMRSMKPTTGFGETFQYSNTLVATGGYVAAHAAEPSKALGAAYDAAMKKHVFAPLGMKATTFDFTQAVRAEHASPHGTDLDLVTRPLSLGAEEGIIAVRPAGAAWSSAHEMTKVLLMELAKGKLPRGKAFVSEKTLLARREPQAKIGDKDAYGLGLFLSEDHGVGVVGHGGNNLGFTSDFFFFPDHDVGIVVLTNAGGANAFRSAVHHRLVEILFDGKPEAARSLDYALAKQKEDLAREKAKITSDAAWAESLAGRYANEKLGDATIRKDGSGWVFDAGEWSSRFARYRETDGHDNVVLVEPPLTGYALRVEEKDGTRSLVLDMPQQTYTFTRK